MSEIKCENYKNEIEKEGHYELKEPSGFCESCESDMYDEYRFCGKECLQSYLSKTP